jgi:hypothetical protein
MTVQSSVAYFASRPFARALRASSTLNQVGLRTDSSGGWASHLQQEGLHDEFLNASGLPEYAFGVKLR